MACMEASCVESDWQLSHYTKGFAFLLLECVELAGPCFKDNLLSCLVASEGVCRKFAERL